MTSNGESIVPEKDLHSFVVRSMEAVGTNSEHASVLADLIVAADTRGHYSHGLNRLDMYVNSIETNTTSHGKGIEPQILKETVATALVEGNNILGPAVGKFAIDVAIQKAKTAGIGLVTVKGSNHFGIAGWYGMRAMEQGLIGMAFTNTSPLLVPTRAKKVTLGTNPICLAAPAKNDDNFVLDMATTSVALGKIELQERKGESMPNGWAIDKEGKETNDPSAYAGLLPLGGSQESSGYKGYGLAMMVEILCGILSGAKFGPNIRTWKDFEKVANLGQCFIAIDPNAFAEGFTDRMSELMDFCRHLEPAESEHPVMVAGDPERVHVDLCKKLGGIPYHQNQITFAFPTLRPMATADKYIVPEEDVHSFIIRCLEAIGTNSEHARALADALTCADTRGIYSHGLSRIGLYVKCLQNKAISDGQGVEPTIVKENVSTALVDGNNILGPAIGKFAMKLAMEKAKNSGIGLVSVRGSSHFGIAGWYGLQAIQNGMIGMAFTNTYPMLVSTRSKEMVLGTNPISLGAPANNGDNFVLDMATTATALGKVELKGKQGQQLPGGWAIDKDGKETRDPKAFQGLLPLGGSEESGGYKGYGLSMMVEVLCGILSGSAFGLNTGNWKKGEGAVNYGQCFIAIDPSSFADGFTDRMTELIDQCRGIESMDPDSPVLIPGDPERRNSKHCKKLGGVPYTPETFTNANDIAKRLGVEPLKAKTG
ncbi:uncharacterized protein LOC125659053 [Ostrea edulis]|uniref:uncharacterized protein LOC125659053 n=1 Tax=Ostrea edulis TaxID=37623 RepID=UPI0024AF9813|nr:uncharacterized protein LOC125659053 [Ostrea edulis]